MKKSYDAVTSHSKVESGVMRWKWRELFHYLVAMYLKAYFFKKNHYGEDLV